MPAPSSLTPEASSSGSTVGVVTESRRADKMELFLRYSQAKAELDALRAQSEREREALLDALRESRAVVHDLREQRDTLEHRLARERTLARKLSSVFGTEDVDGVGEGVDVAARLDELVRTRELWIERAQMAAEELERTRDRLARMETVVQQAHDREAELERENAELRARIAAVEAAARSGTPEGAHDDAEEATLVQPSPAERVNPTNGRVATRAPPARGPRSALPTASTTPPKRPTGIPRTRNASNNSTASSLDGIGQVAGTPLMQTQPSFAPTPSPAASKVPSKLPVSPRSPRVSAIPTSPTRSRIPGASGIPRAGHSRSTSVASVGTASPVGSSVGAFEADRSQGELSLSHLDDLERPTARPPPVLE